MTNNHFRSFKSGDASTWLIIGLGCWTLTTNVAWSQGLANTDVTPTNAIVQSQKLTLQTDNPTVTRGAFAHALVRALGHSQNRVSEFAFYRDVPVTHPDYNSIEVARERKLMTCQEQGYYHPAQLITGAEAVEAIANALASKPPSLEASQMILSPYPAWQKSNMQLQPSLAKLVTAKILPITPNSPYALTPSPMPVTEANLMPMDGPLKQTDMQTMLARLINITKSRYFFTPPDERLLPAIEGGLILSVVPTGALFIERMAIGEHLYFVLTDPVANLPKGSRLEGVVTQKVSNTEYTVDFKEVKSPQGQYYRLIGNMALVFSDSGLIVPGVPYTLITQALDLSNYQNIPQTATPQQPTPLQVPIIPLLPE